MSPSESYKVKAARRTSRPSAKAKHDGKMAPIVERDLRAKVDANALKKLKDAPQLHTSLKVTQSAKHTVCLAKYIVRIIYSLISQADPGDVSESATEHHPHFDRFLERHRKRLTQPER